MSNEQPVSKRQRIEDLTQKYNSSGKNNDQSVSDLIKPSSPTSVLSSTSSSLTTVASTSTTTTYNDKPTHIIFPISSKLKITADNSDDTDSENDDVVDVDDTLHISLSKLHSLDNDLIKFETSLIKQCLCSDSGKFIRTFQFIFRESLQTLPIHIQEMQHKNVIKNSFKIEMQMNKLIKYLSYIQLLFDIYLKHLRTGCICNYIKEICDKIINGNLLFKQICELNKLNNKYVQFIAIRLFASYLIISYYNRRNSGDKNVEILIGNFKTFENDNLFKSLNDLNFSLNVLQRIIEWNDIDIHPSDLIEDNTDYNDDEDQHDEETEEDITDSSSVVDVETYDEDYNIVRNRLNSDDGGNANDNYDNHNNDYGENNHNDEDIDVENIDNVTDNRINPMNSNRLQLPPIENNYFMGQLSAEINGVGTTDSNDSNDENHRNTTTKYRMKNLRRRHYENKKNGITCKLVALNELNTTILKSSIVRVLKHKWEALVKIITYLLNKSVEVQVRQRHQLPQNHQQSNVFELEQHVQNCNLIEYTILIFFSLWENIISIQGNLAFEETLPFYDHLLLFENLLNEHLSISVFKQILTLFNEALCYGSTLALQDNIPRETCKLAERIYLGVRTRTLLNTYPERVYSENPCRLIDYKGIHIKYEHGSLQMNLESTDPLNDMYPTLIIGSGYKQNIDKTLLQKLVLLILKSIAVTVKEIRSDSSDSSTDDSNNRNIDQEAFTEMVAIESSIRDVLSNLNHFICDKMEYHPNIHFSNLLIHLLGDQDEYLIEAMVCTLDVTTTFSIYTGEFIGLVTILNPICTFIEFSRITTDDASSFLLDLLLSNETCFLLYLLRFLKYIKSNWEFFIETCNSYDAYTLDATMSILIRLRLKISDLVLTSSFPYDITPILKLLSSCESLYENDGLPLL